MANQILRRPDPSEYAPYYEGYVSAVPGTDVVGVLRDELNATLALLESVPEAKVDYRYAPGKWTLKEVLLHCSDAERIFTYRALRIARGDTTELPGWDEQKYAPMSGANARPFESLLDELESVREENEQPVAAIFPN